MLKKNILFLRGICDTSEVKVKKINRDGSLHYVMTGSANLHKYLNNEHFDISTIVFDARENQDVVLYRTDAIFNQISDADTHAITLEKVENTYRYFKESIPIFNKPENIRKTKRDIIYDILHNIEKLHVPKTVRIYPNAPSDIYESIEKENLKFPVIFRKAGDHGGISTFLIKNSDEHFHAFCLNGEAYYLTEFVDYKNADGLYVKHRLVVVDGELFLRHVMFGKEWMLHHKNQLEMIEEREAYSRKFNAEVKPFIQPIISDIHARLGLDCFGMDCHIDSEMNILVFEINANMNIFAMAETTVFKEHLDAIRKALISMLIDGRKSAT